MDGKQKIFYSAKKTAKKDKILKKAKRGLVNSEIFFKKWNTLADSI
jgi:hypothetical protein